MDIMRAKELITALADGVDPFTGELLPATSICNHPEIVRALHAILLEQNSKPSKKGSAANAGSPWTVAEESMLAAEFDTGMKIAEIAKLHQRSKGAIESRLAAMGLIEKTNFSGK